MDNEGLKKEADKLFEQSISNNDTSWLIGILILMLLDKQEEKKKEESKTMPLIVITMGDEE